MADKHGEREAKKIIGDKAWNLVMNAVSGGRINKEQLRDLVWFLPTDREKNKLGGNHVKNVCQCYITCAQVCLSVSQDRQKLRSPAPILAPNCLPTKIYHYSLQHTNNDTYKSTKKLCVDNVITQ